MTAWSEALVDAVRVGLPAAAEPGRAPAMRKYMRDQFAFLGVPGPAQKVAFRAAAAAAGKPATATDLSAAASVLWALDEREYQYAGCWILERWAKLLGPDDLAALRALITTKSWWDTVDALAAEAVGSVVLRHPTAAAVMDAWIADSNLWVARTALLHQLRFKERTDTERLFAYCLHQAGHPDFFIRKAIGWALRQYSWMDPDSVERFVGEHASELSPLSKREALLVISGGRKNLPKSRRPTS
ncbi:MAG: DNA alkylation repair protein [Dehalococcoidia bacterium]